MRLIYSTAAMQRAMRGLKARGRTIAFVPTMGALHEGHLALVRRARRLGDVVVVSIFVNPTQFAPNEDFRRYPRTLRRDCALLKAEGVDLVYSPAAEDVYPTGFDTYVVPEKIGGILEGRSRPGHFRGVATVVLKLFNVVQPDVALFGRKDLQQSVVIRQMVRDLNLQVQIVVAPTLRDRDRLALSSRNVYLSADDRRRARAIPDALFAARALIVAGERSAGMVRNFIRRKLVSDGKAVVDYVSVAEATTLEELETIKGNIAVSLACRIGGVRLIDNIVMRVK